MLPFGETVLLWRLHRGMTQAELAQKAAVPRPNLSSIERGDREVTLKTVRALALALEVRPGALVDGEVPVSGRRGFGRETLERIAAAAAGEGVKVDGREGATARRLRAVMTARLGSAGGRLPSRRGDRALLQLRSALGPETVASLVERAASRRRS